MEVKIIGQMDNTLDHTFESANRVYDTQGLCPTIPTCSGGNIQPKIIVEDVIIGGERKNQAVKTDGISTTLLSTMGTGGGNVPMITEEKNIPVVCVYRIRKLTPRECLRLMDVSDFDIDKMAKVNSNSQLYKQAGNSIVVAVMCAMFRNLNIKDVKTWRESNER